MFLIHAKTLKLVEFLGQHRSPYAILSHTWGKEEVSYEEMRNGQGTSKEGYYKIKKCCSQALEDHYDYAWVDTCCINKTSSTELSEAINSMYAWYQSAAVCYAYLADVSSDSKLELSSYSAIRRSKWFTRGWTLQELIAPSNLLFYSSDWVRIGSKRELSNLLAEITLIERSVLTNGLDQSCSVAQKMSWASKRETTRVEDIAYSLLGIFSVNMPLLYGEGERAFVRLQEEIMKDSDDESLFAWGNVRSIDTGHPEHGIQGLLAQSPEDFADGGQIVSFQEWDASQPYTMTNKGLRIHVELLNSASATCALLGCHYRHDLRGPLAIRVLPLNGALGDQYCRVKPSKPVVIPVARRLSPTKSTIFIRKLPVQKPFDAELENSFVVPDVTIGAYQFQLHEVFPSQLWNQRDGILRTVSNDYIVVLSYQCQDGRGFLVLLKYSSESGNQVVEFDVRERSFPTLEQHYRIATTKSFRHRVSDRWLKWEKYFAEVAVDVQKISMIGHHMFSLIVNVRQASQDFYNLPAGHKQIK